VILVTLLYDVQQKSAQQNNSSILKINKKDTYK